MDKHSQGGTVSQGRFDISRAEKILSVAVLAAGFLFRLRQYLFNRSLWLDEAMLANNLVEKPWRSLLFEVLESQQAAPPGFLLASKAVIKVLGPGDLWLRLVPFLSAILLLAAAFFVARRVFAGPLGRLTFLGLVSFSPVLIYYSSEFKQYAPDAAVTVLLVTIALYYHRWKHGPWLFGLLGSVLIWFSHPAIFMLAAIGAVVVLQALSGRDRSKILKSGAMVGGWLASFLALYFSVLHKTASSDFLRQYWVSGYAPFPPTSLTELGWYPLRLLEWTVISFRQLGPVPVGQVVGWADLTNLLLLGVMLVGAAAMRGRSRQYFGFIVGPVAVTLGASLVGLYPFTSRVILFLVPINLLLFGAGIDWLAKQRRFGRLLAQILSFVGLGICLSVALPNFAQPINQNDIKSSLRVLKSNYQSGDLVSISAWSEPAFRFYTRQLNLENIPVELQIGIQNNAEDFLADVCAIGRSQRVWTLFSHRFSERLKLVDPLRGRYPLLLEEEFSGSAVYLWSLAGACSP